MPQAAQSPRTLRTREVWSFALTLLIVLLATAALFEFMLVPRVLGQARRAVEHEMALLLDVRRAAIERWIIDGIADTRTVANFPSSHALVRPDVPHDVDPQFETILGDFAREHGIEAIGVFDSLQHLKASTRRHRFADPTWALLRYRQPSRGEQLVAFVTLEDGEREVAIRVPVPGSSGAVITTQDPKLWLATLLASGGLPIPSARLGLIDRTREGDVPVLGHTWAAVPSEPLLRAERSVPGSSWWLVISAPESNALRTTRERLRWWEAGVMMLLGALTALAFTIVWGQRRAIDAAVQRSRARFSLLLEHANDAILFLDDDGNVIRCNQRAEEFYGVEVRGLTGKHLRRDLEVADPSVAPEDLSREGLPPDGIHAALHRTAGGRTTAVEVSSRRSIVGDRAVTVALVRDVQARVEQERRLVRLNRQLRTAAAVGAAAMREFDETHLIEESVRVAVETGGIEVAAAAVLVSPGAVRWVARTAAPGLAEALPPFPDDLALSAIAAEEPQLTRFDHAELADGAVRAGFRPFLSSGLRASFCVPVRVSGRPWGAVLLLSREPENFDGESRTLIENLVRDVGFAVESIGERRARRELEATLQALFDSGPVGIAVLDGNETLLEANAELLRIIGHSHEEVVAGRVRWADFCLCKAAEGGPMPCASPTPFETDFRRGDGSTIGVFVGRVRLTGGRPRSIAVVLDLTVQRETSESLRQTQLQLLQSQKMETIGRLAGGVAHDFNNLLTVIQGYTQIVQSSGSQSEADAAALAQVLRASDRAAALTRQMLAFSRQQMLEPRVLDLGQVLTETEKMIRRLIGEDVEIVLRLPGNLGRVKADPVQVEQVLLNLVVNARDAMPNGGHLSLEVANFETTGEFLARHSDVAPGSYVLLTVTDDGEGMEPDVLPRIFEPFFTTKESGKGTGLGLATVYGIVRQSGGAIWVQSARHEGTSFHILLPRVYDEEEAAVRPAGRPVGRGETVLVVEDDDMVRPITVAMLERLGYRTIAAADGESALKVVRTLEGPIDLLLSDVVMRGMNGPQLAEAFRLERPDVPVLFVTGYTHDSETLDMLTAGGVPFLPKPFSLDALGQAVRRAVAKRTSSV